MTKKLLASGLGIKNNYNIWVVFGGVNCG